MKSIYAVQPYEVGSKHSKSLALVIPAKVVKECSIDTSTVFALRADEKTKRITLKTVHEAHEYENIMMPTGENLVASNQQAAVEVH
jgi:hypothetical protein